MLDTSWTANMSITSLLLPEPMKAGELYSLAAKIDNHGYVGTLEFWGTNSECGPGEEQLFSAPFESKTYCADVTPTQTFTHVLFVEGRRVPTGGSGSAADGEVIACGSNHCPAP